MNETDLGKLLQLEVCRRIPTIRLFRRNVGMARMEDGSVVKFAIAGQGDFWFITRDGKHGEIETKNVRTPKTAAQKRWAEFCGEWRAIYLELRAQRGETSEQTINRWLAELEEALTK